MPLSPTTKNILDGSGASFSAPVAGTDANGNPLVAIAPNASTTAATITQTFVSIATANTAVALAGTSTLVSKVLIFGQKAEQTANTGIVRIGFNSSSQPIAFPVATIDQSGVFTIDAPAGKKIDLNQMYVNGANVGDGVLVIGCS